MVKNYEMVPVDLSKQKACHVDPKSTKQINFTGNLDKTGNTTMFFIAEETKRHIFHFSVVLGRFCFTLLIYY